MAGALRSYRRHVVQDATLGQFGSYPLISTSAVRPINFIGYDEPAALSESNNCDLVFVSQGDHFLTVKH